MKDEELQAFTIQALIDATGPLVMERGTAATTYVSSLVQSLDSRLERVSYQQYVRVAVVRRDAAYELCGMRGVLVLSGADLRGTSSEYALRPIRRRLLIWIAGSVMLLLVANAFRDALLGGTAYFARSDACVSYIIWAALVGSIFVLGACLRELKAGLRVGRLRGVEKVAGVGVCSLLVCAAAAASFARPTVAEIHRSLASGDVGAARRAIDGLRAIAGSTREVDETDDLVALAEARNAPVSEALALLDRVARGGRIKSKEASDAARARRVEEIGSRIREKAGAEAIALVDRWFPVNWKSVPEVSELRARAEEVQGEECTTVPCQFGAASRASRAAPTPARIQQAELLRRELLKAVTLDEQPADSALAKLQRLRATADIAGQAREQAGDDAELVAAITKTIQAVSEQRARTPLLGASEGVLDEVVAPFSRRSGNLAVANLAGVSIHAILDQQHVCRGLYAVGPSEGSRAITSSTWSAERILSQAFGRVVTVRSPGPGAATVSRWVERGVPIVARWRSGSIVELRIGDATP